MIIKKRENKIKYKYFLNLKDNKKSSEKTFKIDKTKKITGSNIIIIYIINIFTKR